MLRPFLGVALLLLAFPILLAQTRANPQAIPDGGTREILVSIFIPSLPNAPFTATVQTEWIRSLPDGTTITLKNHRLIARDKQGRIFQERRLLVPEEGQRESVITQTEISDPLLHQQYICVPQERVCQLEAFTPRDPAPEVGSPGQDSLGKQTIAGLETVGRREIRVIPTGTIGNDASIVSRREFWYSPQLGCNLLSTRQDPRFGFQKFELSDVVLGDPDQALFELPSGSEVLDLRKPAPTPAAPPAN